MPSVEITNRAVYQTYYNGGEIASSDYRMVGYSNAGGSVRFSTCYEFVLPSYEGTPDSISLTVHLKNENSAYYSGKTWKLGIANSLNGVYADGVYTSYGSHTVSFSGDIAPGATQTFTVNITSSDAMFYPGATIYLYVYSGAAEFNEARIAALTGVMYYTAPTRYISTYRNTNYCSAISAYPSAVANGGGSVIIAYTPYNTASYIYHNPKIYLGTNEGGALVAQDSGYTTLNSRASVSYTQNNITSNLAFFGYGSRTPASPGTAACTVSGIEATKATVNVADGINTVFLNSYYYLSTTNEVYTQTLQSPTSFSRKSRACEVSNLLEETNYTMQVYAYNEYNGYYYRIGSVSFTTKRSYVADATVPTNSVLQSQATVTMSNLSSATNLSGNLYVFGGISETLTSLPSTYYVGCHNGSTGTVNVTGLQSGACYQAGTFGLYVYNSVNGTYYRVASVPTFSTVTSYANRLSRSYIVKNDAVKVFVNTLDNLPGYDGVLYSSFSNKNEVSSLTAQSHNVTEANKTFTRSGLNSSTQYTLYLYLKNKENQRYYQIGSITFETYPAPFDWTYKGKDPQGVKVTGARKVEGAYFCLTAIEWNSFTGRINEHLTYAGVATYTFSQVEVGSRVAEAHINQALNALNTLPRHGTLIPLLSTSPYSWKITPALLKADTYNTLMDALNATIPDF